MFFRKKAIILIHGFVGGIYDYDNFQNELQLIRKFDVFTYTLPGHEKMFVKDVKYKDWVTESERQVEFLINNGYRTIYVVGHSMGGVIASYLASKYKQIKKVVLVAPAFRYFCFKDGKVNIKGFNETIKEMPELFKNIGANKVLERIQKTPIQTMLEFTKFVGEYQDKIKDVYVPTLIIHGTNDNVVPKEATDFIYDNIPSESVILYNVDKLTHDCFVGKRKDDIKRIITVFLKKRQKKQKKTFDI